MLSKIVTVNTLTLEIRFETPTRMDLLSQLSTQSPGNARYSRIVVNYGQICFSPIQEQFREIFATNDKLAEGPIAWTPFLVSGSFNTGSVAN